MLFLADVGGAQNAQPLGVGGHEAVLDAVVNHLDEMAGAVRTAVQIALLGGAVQLLASRSARRVARARRQRREDRIEMLDHVLFAADHHAVAALQAPDAAARPHIHVVDSLCRKFLGAPDVIHVIGIAAVDEDVSGSRCGRSSAMVSSTAAAGTISQIARGFSSFATKSWSEELPVAFSCTRSLTAFGDLSNTTHSMASFEEPAHHVCSHPSKTNHSELHELLLRLCQS